MSAMSVQLIGQSESFHALMDHVSNTASLDRPVLIVGERGTGKEMIASRLHFLSPRWEALYVKVNCAAFSDDMLDRELFGQTFMDGRDDTNGRFYEANGGKYGEYEAGGEAETQQVDVHLITATAIDLPMAVDRGEFRADLIDRLAFDVITLPPLRTRREDIAPLAEHFSRKIVAELGAEAFPGFTAEVMTKLEAEPWPGNIRELKTIVERNVAQAYLRDETLSQPISTLNLDPFDSPYRLRGIDQKKSAPQDQAQSLPLEPQPNRIAHNDDQPEAITGFSDRVMVFERRLIDEAMSLHAGHQGKAANYLGLTYHSFRGLLRKHGLKK